MVVNLRAGSLVGAWIGAAWATRMWSSTLYQVIAVLLVFIAAALAVTHLTAVGTLDLTPGLRTVVGVGIGVVAAVMGVAGGELLIRRSCCSTAWTSRSLAACDWRSPCPPCWSPSPGTAETTASTRSATIGPSSLSWRSGRSLAR